MAISCGVKCARSILLTFNIAFWISGCALLVLGVWLIVEPSAGRLLSAVAPENLPIALHLPLAYALVTIGGLILLVGFIGCCGALQESKCLIAAYFVFLVIILAAELSLAVGTLIFREHTIIDMESRLMTRVRNNYGQDDHQDFSLAIDYLQFKVTHPAGSPISVVSRVFYGHVDEPWQNPQPLDEVACQDINIKIFETARHRQGCMRFIEDEFKRDSLIIIAAGIIAGALEVLGMIFSICLCKNVTDDI